MAVSTAELGSTAVRILEKRYLRRNASGDVVESIEEMFARVARDVARAEFTYGGDQTTHDHWTREFFDLMASRKFLPNSPTLMNAGTELQQLSACFVLPVGDSIEEIFEAVKYTALIHKSGGGTGFSFSHIRPNNDAVQSTQGVSSGPLSFMQVFDAATEAIKQGGRRRGANMGILRIDHPDILSFIEAKSDDGLLRNFNISVAVTDRFMSALANDEDYELINPRGGAVWGRLSARQVFETIAERAWHNGEPGIVFIDRVNQHNPTPALGDIDSTNPCGEQPLLPYESCNLGSINLTQFVNGEVGEGVVDYDGIADATAIAVRFLDDVVDVNRYPLEAIERTTKGNRKIGLGVMGFAEMLIMLGIAYDDDEAVATAERVMDAVNCAAHRASRELAGERGPFPTFPDSVYARRGEPALRNATVTTIAPTGTISMIAGTSSGIEPLFALAYKRFAADETFVEINPLFERVARDHDFYSDELRDELANGGGTDCIPERWHRLFRTAHDVSTLAHVRIQAAFQKHTDNAVSKTVNFANEATTNDVKEVFLSAYSLGCKGVTIYRDGSRSGQVLSTGESEAKRPPRSRPATVDGATHRVGTGCGNLYVTINRSDAGPFEVFAHMGKAGGCAASYTEAIGRLVSLSLRANVEPHAIVKQLRGVRCPSPGRDAEGKVFSCADGIGRALANCLEGDPDPSVAAVDLLAGVCSDCGGELEHEGGCIVCHFCGFSRC